VLDFPSATLPRSQTVILWFAPSASVNAFEAACCRSASKYPEASLMRRRSIFQFDSDANGNVRDELAAAGVDLLNAMVAMTTRI